LGKNIHTSIKRKMREERERERKREREREGYHTTVEYDQKWM
jgi:hypothetical protein